jgi:hypothetical protein
MPTMLFLLDCDVPGRPRGETAAMKGAPPVVASSSASVAGGLRPQNCSWRAPPTEPFLAVSTRFEAATYSDPTRPPFGRGAWGRRRGSPGASGARGPPGGDTINREHENRAEDGYDEPDGLTVPYQPRERPTNPPDECAHVPRTAVRTKPPGSRSGKRNLATIPTIRTKHDPSYDVHGLFWTPSAARQTGGNSATWQATPPGIELLDGLQGFVHLLDFRLVALPSKSGSTRILRADSWAPRAVDACLLDLFVNLKLSSASAHPRGVRARPQSALDLRERGLRRLVLSSAT